jgi:hypothetical protein
VKHFIFIHMDLDGILGWNGTYEEDTVQRKPDDGSATFQVREPGVGGR